VGWAHLLLTIHRSLHSLYRRSSSWGAPGQRCLAQGEARGCAPRSVNRDGADRDVFDGLFGCIDEGELVFGVRTVVVRFRLLAPSVSAPRRLKVEILKLGHDGCHNIFFKWLFVFLCRIAACKRFELFAVARRRAGAVSTGGGHDVGRETGRLDSRTMPAWNLGR